MPRAAEEWVLGAVLFLIVASAVKRYASTIPAPLEPVTPGVVAVVAAKLDLPPDLVYADIMTMMREQAPPKIDPPITRRHTEPSGGLSRCPGSA